MCSRRESAGNRVRIYAEKQVEIVMKVAVFGAGTMGLGIIQVFAEKGHTVLVYDISMDFVRNQVQKLEASLVPNPDSIAAAAKEVLYK